VKTARAFNPFCPTAIPVFHLGMQKRFQQPYKTEKEEEFLRGISTSSGNIFYS